MLVQSTPNYSIQRQNFGAKLIASEPVQKKLQQGVMDFYNELSPEGRKLIFPQKPSMLLKFWNGLIETFKKKSDNLVAVSEPNPQRLWDGLVKAFEKKTRKIPGVVEFIRAKKEAWGILAGIKYTNGKNVYIVDNVIGRSICIPGPDGSYSLSIKVISSSIEVAIYKEKVKGKFYKRAKKN